MVAHAGRSSKGVAASEGSCLTYDCRRASLNMASDPSQAPDVDDTSTGKRHLAQRVPSELQLTRPGCPLLQQFSVRSAGSSTCEVLHHEELY